MEYLKFLGFRKEGGFDDYYYMGETLLIISFKVEGTLHKNNVITSYIVNYPINVEFKLTLSDFLLKMSEVKGFISENLPKMDADWLIYNIEKDNMRLNVGVNNKNKTPKITKKDLVKTHKSWKEFKDEESF